MVYRGTGWACPRDGTVLENERFGTTSFLRCKTCRGALVALSSVASMFEEMGGTMPQGQVIPADPLLYCPICSTALTRVLVPGAQVELDSCEDHGVWFDARELTTMLEHIGLDALERRTKP